MVSNALSLMIYLSDLLLLVVLLWMTIGTGLLFCFPPVSITAKRIRMAVLVGMFGAVGALSMHSAIPMTKGDAYLQIWIEIWRPIGRPVILPYYPYAYLFYRLFPIFGFGSMFAATIGPIIYLLQTRRDSSRG
jgi:hypothetical protein